MEPFIGQICNFPYNFSPEYWAYCHGQLMPISSNEVLFSLLGTTFGGDGRKTFALPDLRWKDDKGNVLQLVAGEIYNGKVYTESFIALQGIYPTRN